MSIPRDTCTGVNYEYVLTYAVVVVIVCRTSRWYMRIAFWIFDAAIHNMWVIVSFYAAAATKPEDRFWRYRGPGSRRLFQLDLSQLLIAEGVKTGIEANGGSKPRWMRQIALVPCRCGTCYFCLHEAGAASAASPAEAVREVCEANERTEVHHTTGRCVVCVRAATAQFPSLSRVGLQRRSGVTIRQTKFGCAGCTERTGQKVFICAVHWAEYEHDWTPLSRRSVRSRVCDDCSHPLMATANFCCNCGKPTATSSESSN